MSNFAFVLKDEITRLSRKETRSETDKLRKASTQYRSEIAALKRRMTQLEQQVSRIEKLVNSKVPARTEPEVTTKVRFTAKGFKTLRHRLGMTATEMATLLEVSAPTIYNWEAGSAKPREPQMARIVVLRGLGKRDVDAILKR